MKARLVTDKWPEETPTKLKAKELLRTIKKDHNPSSNVLSEDVIDLLRSWQRDIDKPFLFYCYGSQFGIEFDTEKKD